MTNSNETTETTALSTIITRDHTRIGESLLMRVKDMISRENIEIKTYEVSVGRASYDSDTEKLSLQINEKTTLMLYLQTSRS